MSPREWNKGKPTWEWLFPIIDTNRDGQIDTAEYLAFQVYKDLNPDWRTKRPKAHD